MSDRTLIERMMIARNDLLREAMIPPRTVKMNSRTLAEIKASLGMYHTPNQNRSITGMSIELDETLQDGEFKYE